MIYMDSIRHFVQEWIEIAHPHDDREWKWRRTTKLYLLNLYAIPSADTFTMSTLPTPFISILINGLDGGKPYVDSTDAVYKGYFAEEPFTLPRKYLFDPFNEGKTSIKVNRYTFGSNGYKGMEMGASDQRLLYVLSNRNHHRHSIYKSNTFDILRDRIEDLQNASGATIRVAENLMDITLDACIDEHTSPDLMIIQAPTRGIIYPIRKACTYRIINGAFVLCHEDVMTAVPCEPVYQQYRGLTVPMRFLENSTTTTNIGCWNGNANAVVYIAVESFGGTFSFPEYLSTQRMRAPNGDDMVYMLSHNFNIVPYTTGKNMITALRLGHEIQEGFILDTPAHRKYFTPSNQKLFKRSDMPDGFFKSPGGKTITMGIDL